MLQDHPKSNNLIWEVNMISKLIRSIKKIFSNRTIIIISFLIFVIGISSYIFKSQVGSFIWGIRCKSPVLWNNVKITFPKEIVYKKFNEDITFFYWEDPNEGFLHLIKKDLNRINKNNMVGFIKSKNFQILETKDLLIKGNNSFIISYFDNESKEYFKRIYIIPKNIYILYEGKRKECKDFDKMLDSLIFYNY
jgi:hypothetical protein